jgi:hypothetical protein
MTRDQGYQLGVWVRSDEVPAEVVAQVYDHAMRPVGGLRPVPTHAAVQALMDEYAIPPGRWDLSDDAVRILDEQSAAPGE